MRRPLICLVLLLCLGHSAVGYTLETQKSNVSIPDPLRFYTKYERVWEGVRSTLVEMDFDIESEDRAGGKIKTRFSVFSSGGLTSGDLVKFCSPPRLTDGSWVKARYSIETVLERLGQSEILFTANVNVEGTKRDFAGNETWIECSTTGTLERRLYSLVGKKLLGGGFFPSQKQGFWDKKPQPVPRRKTAPTLPKPDRPPPR